MTPQQISQFKESGYTTVAGFFAAQETRAMQHEVARWLDDGLPRDVSIPAAKENRQLIPLWPHSRLFRALPFHPKVAAAVSALLGDPVAKILDQMFYKPARRGLGTNWHTDNAYFGLDDPLRGCAMWIAVHDAHQGNGGLKVVPGAFRQRLLHERDPDSDHHIRTYVDEEAAVHCELAAGGVAFFCFGTPHATGANPTASGRAGVGIHFVNYDHAHDDMASGRRWQPVVVTGERATGGEREYGRPLSFEAELASVLGANPGGVERGQ